ncbi:uncharacterized protein LOC144577428 [Callithrix jacchus]
MFPSAVTALTEAGRNRSPERAGRERARLREREESGEGGGGRRVLGGLSRGEAAPRVRGSAGGAESRHATPSPARKSVIFLQNSSWNQTLCQRKTSERVFSMKTARISINPLRQHKK